MANDRTDRRVRKTKALLLRGLIQLMETKDVQNISVKELSDLADINRGTFYLHYSDVHDMLRQIEDELFVEFQRIIDRTLTPDSAIHSLQTTLSEVFVFLERHREMARVMMGPHGDLAFLNRLKDLVQERLDSILASKLASGDSCYLEAFIVSGCVGVIETWLSQPDAPSPEAMRESAGEGIPVRINPHTGLKLTYLFTILHIPNDLYKRFNNPIRTIPPKI